MRQAIYDLLSADGPLLALLSGGLYHTAGEISRQETPGAFDAHGEILPCALLKLSTANPNGPYADSGQLFFNLYFYQQAGFATITAALERGYALLHQQKVTPTAGACWVILHANDVLDQEDTALRCGLAVSRYMAVVSRR